MEVENYPDLKETNLGGTDFPLKHDCGRKSSKNPGALGVLVPLLLFGPLVFDHKKMGGVLHGTQVRQTNPRLLGTIK